MSEINFIRPIYRDQSYGADDQIGPSVVLACPSCGYEFTHLSGKPTKLHGWESALSNGEPVAWEGRGNGWRILVNGECGHAWTLNFGSHKGETFLFARPVKESEMYRRQN